MKRKQISIFLALGFLSAMLCSCGNPTDSSATTDKSSSAADTIQDAKDQVASPDEMATPQDVVDSEMEAIPGTSIQDGTYSITVDSSSSMFSVTACELTVESGKMTAAMTMSGTGYLYVYMGTGEEAAAADESSYIPFTENADGTHTFTVPVEALDAGIDCAAFSKKKKKWYERTLVFRADSLPADAFADGVIPSVEDLHLQDGVYLAEVTLEGGSGKASVASPTKITVENGTATAEIIWSSSNYDYMKVEGVQYDPVRIEENAVFEIPVLGFDYKMPVLADTTAMSTPHEIEYTLYFDSTTLEAQ